MAGMRLLPFVLKAAAAADETKPADELIDHGTALRGRGWGMPSVWACPLHGSHPEFPVAKLGTYGRLMLVSCRDGHLAPPERVPNVSVTCRVS